MMLLKMLLEIVDPDVAALDCGSSVDGAGSGSSG